MSDTATLTRLIDGREAPAAGTYAIDPTHSTVGFVARHLMVTKVRGQFDEFEGNFTIAEDPTESQVEAVIKTASLDSHDGQRDAHVKSADFLDVERYPDIRFRGTKVAPAGKAWKLEGELTIRDVTRPVVLDLDFGGSVKDPWGGVRAGFTATTELNRDDWGITWNVALETGGFLVGKKITVELDIEGIRQ